MKVKFSFIPENILVQIDNGDLIAELTEEQYFRYKEAEEEYFTMQNIVKEMAKTQGGNKYFDGGR